MRNFFRNLEIDLVDILGGILILCQVAIIVGVIMMYVTR